MEEQKHNLSEDTLATIQLLKQSFSGERDPIFYRSRFVRSNDFKKNYLLELSEVPELLGEIYASLNMPRYIWLVEFSLHTDICIPISHPDDCDKRKIVGEILLDATGGADINSLIALHLPGAVGIGPFYLDIEDEPEGVDPERPSARTVNEELEFHLLPNDRPYSPFNADRMV